MEDALKKNSDETSDTSTLAEDQKRPPAQREQSDTLLPTTKLPAYATLLPFATPEPMIPKKTRKKDKNKPKRPLSAYNIFFKDERIRYLKEQKEQGPSESKDNFLNMSREIGRRWMNLSSGRRKYYEALAEEAMFRYRLDMDAYKAKKQLEDASLLVRPSAAVATTASNSICPTIDARSFIGAHSMTPAQVQNQTFDIPSSTILDLQSILGTNNTSVRDSFLLSNHASALPPPTGLSAHLLRPVVAKQQQQPSNDSLQAAARTNLLDHLLLQRLAHLKRELVEDAATMRLNALLAAQRPAVVLDPSRPRSENPSLFRNDSHMLYESVAQSLPSVRVDAHHSQVNQPNVNNDKEARQQKELLEFVQQQQNPQWAEFLNMENPNPNNF